MRRVFLLTLVTLILLAGPGCGPKSPPPTFTAPPPPKAAPPPPDTVDRPAPAISISADPSTIERGEQTTLSWQSSNASSILIDGGVGNVSESGSIVVSPLQSTTYTAVARGSGGENRASTRVTVVEPRPAPAVFTDADLLEQRIQAGEVQPIFFAYDKADLTPQAIGTLQANALVFRDYPSVRIVVEGHCDERGTEEYNLALGDRRALAAHEYLVRLGVDPDQLETISFGEERPFDPGHDEQAWAKNRRAHFTVRR